MPNSRSSRSHQETLNASTDDQFTTMLRCILQPNSSAEALVAELHAMSKRSSSEKTRRGTRRAVERGGVPGGKTYGYDIVRGIDERGDPLRGLRIINEGEAQIVRLIFNQFESGVRPREICRQLNEKGILSPRGKLWHQTTLLGTASRQSGILRQTLYVGLITFCKQEHHRQRSGKRTAIPRSKDEWIRVAVPYLRIIEMEQFERIQDVISNGR